MDRRPFVGATALLGVAPAWMARAQPAARVYRIGYLASAQAATVSAPPDALMVAFIGRLQELGYAQGRNLVVERRTAEGDNDRYRALAAELVRLKVDLIIAPGTASALAAKEATSTIPIVIVVAGDPVGTGLAASLARPGGNVTGMTSSGGEVTVKQLELITEILPGISRVAVLFNGTNVLHGTLLKELGAVARPLRIGLRPVDVRTPQDLEASFASIAREKTEALIPLDDPLAFQERRRIAEFALRERLPTASFQRFFTEAGTLFSYGPSFRDLFLRAASFADRIFKGARPADLPIEQPNKFELVINLKTASALGLKIPPVVVQRADELIR